MEKTCFASAFLLALLVLALAGGQRTDLATANPVWLGYFPIEPDTSPLGVTVQSPTQNQTCNSTNVWLDFTVTKPETWLKLTDSRVDKYMIIGKITSAYYSVEAPVKKSY